MDIYKLLSSIREKDVRKIVGLMSGTSADGLTIAITEIKGAGLDTSLRLLDYRTFPYPPKMRTAIFQLFDPNTSTVDKICRMNFVLGEFFVDSLTKLLGEKELDFSEIDLIGSHGQTIYHSPEPEKIFSYSTKSTLQIGEAAVIAQRTGIPTIADFRKADVAAGGEGAPLTPYLDFILHRHKTKHRILQNIGGIANLTYLPADPSLDEIVAFDTGPGNMVIDAVVKHHTFDNQHYDENGNMALRGKVDQTLLEQLLDHQYFKKEPPKTTGRETFGEFYAKQIIADAEKHNLSIEDVVATVSMLTVESIAKSYEKLLPLNSKIDEVYVSGGGAKNKFIISSLKTRLKPIPVKEYEQLGFPGEAKEAVLMAVLANEYIMGNKSNVPIATGANKPVFLGQLYLPSQVKQI